MQKGDVSVKKVLTAVCAAVLMFAVTACGNRADTQNSQAAETKAVTKTEITTGEASTAQTENQETAKEVVADSTESIGTTAEVNTVTGSTEAVTETPAAQKSNDAKAAEKIKITTPDGEIVIALENPAASEDLLSRLPMTLHFEDFNRTEKISYLDTPLDTSGAVTEYAPKAGSFAYYIPWGNLSVFYEDFRESSDLASLGTVESGMEYVRKMDSYAQVTIETAEQNYQ